MKIPNKGDIWLVHYPYITPGNMEKIRPAIIKSINEKDDTLIVQKLTTQKHHNIRFIHPKLKKITYLSNEYIKINNYNLIRYIGKDFQGKKVIK